MGMYLILTRLLLDMYQVYPKYVLSSCEYVLGTYLVLTRLLLDMNQVHTKYVLSSYKYVLGTYLVLTRHLQVCTRYKPSTC